MEEAELEKYLKQIRGTFMTECRDYITAGEALIDNLYKTFQGKPKGKRSDVPAKAMRELRRIVHNLKCTTSSSRAIKRFPALAVIGYRLEDYLSNMDRLTLQQCKDVAIFFEYLSAALKEGEQADVSGMVRELPVFRSGGRDARKQTVQAKSFPSLKERPDGAPAVLEAVLIMPSGKPHRKLIEQALDSCGFRITNISSSTHAIDLVLDMKPDIIISSYVIDDLVNGVELARIFHLLPATRKTPYVLMTSFSKQSKELKSLPDSAKIARKDKHFLEDFAGCLLG